MHFFYTIVLSCLSLLPVFGINGAGTRETSFLERSAAPCDTMPASAARKADNIALTLKEEAGVRFNVLHLPGTLDSWTAYKKALRRRIWDAAGVRVDHTLPLDYHETGAIQRRGYKILKIYFRTRPGVYATANLYVPDGKGPFPAVVNLHGHWAGGKTGEMVQACAHELALNGYVCLNIDAWGSGERTTIHGVHEYHGSNLGASLMDIGETLLGNQLADNIRAVDLLCSLKYVDKNRIGATGASGGGNQTMWLAAMDERIKACVPVVNVGTFQSYIMGSNCVCELLPGGLTFTEEAGVLALISPRALKIFSGQQDRNKAFFPSEMLRSFANVRPVYELYHQPEHISYRVFDTPHGYWPAMREDMLGWFRLYLKNEGDGSPIKEIPFMLLPEDQLMVFPKGQRSPLVKGTAAYCRQRGTEMAGRLKTLRTIDQEMKRDSLRRLIDLPDDGLQEVYKYATGERWSQAIIQTKNNRLIPFRVLPPSGKENKTVLVFFTDKEDPKFREKVLAQYTSKGYRVVMADLWGTGTNASPEAIITDGSLPPFHTLSRAELWLGHSVIGEWANEIALLKEYCRRQFASGVTVIDGSREIAVAVLVQSALYDHPADALVLRTCPISYVPDSREGIDFFNMALHQPGIQSWGGIPLLAALSRCPWVSFGNPVSLSGIPVPTFAQQAFATTVKQLKAACGTGGRVSFTNIYKP